MQRARIQEKDIQFKVYLIKTKLEDEKDVKVFMYYKNKLEAVYTNNAKNFINPKSETMGLLLYNDILCKKYNTVIQDYKESKLPKKEDIELFFEFIASNPKEIREQLKNFKDQTAIISEKMLYMKEKYKDECKMRSRFTKLMSHLNMNTIFNKIDPIPVIKKEYTKR